MPNTKVPLSKMKSSGRWFIWIIGLSLAVIFTITLSLTSKVVSDLERQRSASSDNVQWTLTQVEVEYLSFLNALESNLLGSDAPLPLKADLPDVRRQFDVFYSRVDTLERSGLYAPLRQEPDFSRPLGATTAFLDRTVPLIDGPDGALQAQIALILQDADSIRTHVRELSLKGLAYFARTADARRADTAFTLAQLAALSAMLLAVLALASVYLLYVNRITRKRGDELVQINQRIETVLSTSLDGVIVSNADGKVLQFNEAAEKIFGHSFAEAKGKSIGQLIVPPHLRGAHDAGMTRMKEGGERRVVGHGRVQLEAMRKNGEIFPVELALQSAFDGEEEIVIAFMRDISNRVAAQEELISARDRALAGEKAKADFLTVMSHEIRTPLNGLLGNLSLLKNAKPSREQKQFLHNMEVSGQVLLNHVDTVLDIARFEAGKLTVKREPIDLGALLQEIVDSQSGNAATRGNAIEWQWAGPAAPWVETDTQRLRQVLLNLVGNAIKFTENGRISLEVEVAEPPEWSGTPIYEFRVIDTGVGIEQADLDKVFEDFHTRDASLGRTAGGTGLGLGIARRFAEAMSGEIGVESTPGEGSVFWVRLPLSQVDPENSRKPQTPEADRLEKLDLLVVEDNEINLEVIRNMLEMDGHRVSTAMDGQSGVNAANAHRFDAILMDISMPVMDGPTATRHIRAGQGRSADVPILAVSANVLPQAVDEFREAGMNAFLGKPLTLTALRKALAALIEESGREDVPEPDDDPLVTMRADLGEAAFFRLLRRFLEEGDAMMERLHKRGQTTAALPQLAAESHKLAGSAALFGAMEMRDVLIEIEMAATAGAQDDLATFTRKAEGVWARTRKHLPDPS